jgi:hypothetical protein
MTSLKKALGQHLFLLGKTWRNKKDSKLNHETLGGLMDNACFYLARPGGKRRLPSSTMKRSGA